MDGEFAALHKFGFPLPALATVQEVEAQLTYAVSESPVQEVSSVLRLWASLKIM